jgi:hypothetical protein
VKVAGGAILTSSTVLPALSWSSNGHKFIDSFRVLALDSYDGIIGWDWLAKYSPMLTHWGEQWIAIQMRGEFVVLHGEEAYGNSPTILELHILSDQALVSPQHPHPGIQALLDEFASVLRLLQIFPHAASTTIIYRLFLVLDLFPCALTVWLQLSR